ncbi:hypothetical protein KPA96_13660 [Burkholderia cenocepacia]|uniref:hypothetical protein n=1 Tax=Burkholderia cenocepacia TaxID=95486 RepID=UPI0028617754|nr:hypothetical protein [Burkholderia cenocepacia]MDR8076703.1 hypothetical protein [Burkholderia cenocepacia]
MRNPFDNEKDRFVRKAGKRQLEDYTEEEKLKLRRELSNSAGPMLSMLASMVASTKATNTMAAAGKQADLEMLQLMSLYLTSPFSRPQMYIMNLIEQANKQKMKLENKERNSYRR